MQNRKMGSLQLVLSGNSTVGAILFVIFLTIGNFVNGQNKMYRVSDYGLTFYYDTTDNGIAKTVYGNRYIRIFYLPNNLLRLECYRSFDSSIAEKGNYIVDTMPKNKLASGRDIDTGSSLSVTVIYYELKRTGLWCFYNKRKVRKVLYE
jgi:hypothetical protein